jgi:hypothetical protein
MSAIETLTFVETKRFEILKTQIQVWWNDRLKIGEALREIQAKKLYRSEYRTFEEFCLASFGLQRRQAYRLIEAAEVKESIDLCPIGHKIQNEGQARALAFVPESERATVLEEAAKSGAVTAKSITEAAAKATVAKPEKLIEQQLDKTGYAIPQSILEDWNRAEETSRLMLSQISKLKIQLKNGLDPDTSAV